ncbi:MAG: DUF3362 domain-containing protein, partial [Faecousia sp.]
IQYRNPKNYYLVKEALIKAHREDLIGSGPKCLIRAVPPRTASAPPAKAPSRKASAKTAPKKGPASQKVTAKAAPKSGKGKKK